MILFLLATLCLVDSILFLKFKTRLKISDWVLLKNPLSFLSSAKKMLFPFVVFLIVLWHFPLLGLPFLMITARPHPLFKLLKEVFQRKKMKASFPIDFSSPKGNRLFEIKIPDQPHILFISLESFRAKNVGALGAKKGLSPHFDALASQGILFNRFHATGNLTNRSIIATLLGLFPAHEIWHLGPYCDLKVESLPKILKKQGYHTAVIQGGSTAFDHEAEFFEKHGVETILGKRDIAKPGTSWGVFDEYLMPFAAQFLSEQKKPTFLNLYTITNHHPWIHPQGKNGFFNTFSYTDQALHILIEELRKKNLLEKSILFIYGDHGQETEERTPYFEINSRLFQDTLHVPLLIYAKGRIEQGQIIDTLASQIDLLPTVLDLLNLSLPHHGEGKSLLRPSNDPIFFSHPFEKDLKGYRHGDRKFVHDNGKKYSFDLIEDPEEKSPLLETDLPVLDAFFQKLEAHYLQAPFEKIQGKLSLEFQNSLELTDQKLSDLLEERTDLSSIKLNHCLLLTDRAIEELLFKCPKLEKLHLSGQEDLTAQDWPTPSHLIEFKATHCPSLQIDWIKSLPSLRILILGGLALKDEDLKNMAAHQKDLSALVLEDCDLITNEGLSALLAVNEQLSIVHIKNCPHITENTFQACKSKLLRFTHIAKI